MTEKKLEVFDGAVAGKLDGGGFAGDCTDHDFSDGLCTRHCRRRKRKILALLSKL